MKSGHGTYKHLLRVLRAMGPTGGLGAIRITFNGQIIDAFSGYPDFFRYLKAIESLPSRFIFSLESSNLDDECVGSLYEVVADLYKTCRWHRHDEQTIKAIFRQLLIVSLRCQDCQVATDKAYLKYIEEKLLGCLFRFESVVSSHFLLHRIDLDSLPLDTIRSCCEFVRTNRGKSVFRNRSWLL